MSDLIRERRTTRRFTEDKVSRDEILKAIDSARFAPSWKNSQTARYYICDSREILDRLAIEASCGFEKNKVIMSNAPALIAVSTVERVSGFDESGNTATVRGEHWQSFDAGIATQTLCLALWELRLGSVIMGLFDDAVAGEILGVSEGERIAALVAVGHPAVEPSAPPRKQVSEIAKFVE